MVDSNMVLHINRIFISGFIFQKQKDHVIEENVSSI